MSGLWRGKLRELALWEVKRSYPAGVVCLQEMSRNGTLEGGREELSYGDLVWVGKDTGPTTERRRKHVRWRADLLGLHDL